MRFVICGAGAVGGTIAGLLDRSGEEVAMVARGAHGEAIRSAGLTLHTPEFSHVANARGFSSVSDVDWREDDVAIVATKLQDSASLLDDLALAAPHGMSVVCAQNGLAGERMAARRGFATYGMMVWMPATYLKAGVVRVHGSPAPGVLDVGAWPSGRDSLAELLAERLTNAGFEAFARDDVMAWKRAKLRTNVVGMAKAIASELSRAFADGLRDETDAVFQAAGHSVTPWEEFSEHRAAVRLAPAGGEERGGGSAWQSLTTGRSSEVDFLCGEVVMLGREFGVPTPLNDRVVRETHALVAGGGAPRSVELV